MAPSDINRLHERIDALTETTAELIGAVRSFEASCGPCKQTVERHEDAINGNGSEGLRRDVKGLMTVQQSHTATLRDMRSTRRKQIWESVRLVAAIVVGVLLTRYAA